MSEDRFQLLRLLEAVLFASTEPLAEKVLKARLPEDADLPGLLSELAETYANRGVHLMKTEDRWAFRTSPDLAQRLQIERKVSRKLSRAATETLAIIAYHQPVTRAEIEEIRGVIISKGTLDLLLEIDWIKPHGRRETPGRPVTWATTGAFLEHFGLEGTEALPGVEELRAAGLLDSRAAISTLATQASAGHAGGPDDTADEDAAAEELRGELALGAGEDETPADDDYESALLEQHGDTEADAAESDDGDGGEDEDGARTRTARILTMRMAPRAMPNPKRLSRNARWSPSGPKPTDRPMAVPCRPAAPALASPYDLRPRDPGGMRYVHQAGAA